MSKFDGTMMVRASKALSESNPPLHDRMMVDPKNGGIISVCLADTMSYNKGRKNCQLCGRELRRVPH